MNTKEQVDKVKRDKHGRWLPGHSPNPKGRPANVEKVRHLLLPHKESLISKAVEMALDGDVSALKVCLDRISPPLKSQAECAVIPDIKPNDSLVTKTSKVIAATTDGSISVDTAKNFVSLFIGHSNLIKFEEFEKRITALEAINN